ncbi:hypothetical protein NZK35_09760 [Stieleria sp. ICT_E10.1]|uniref:hypothetical protein n=1 Tax=Stieleria sedimenti TaxID=2976331 RepID=UPI0021807DF0|nr:hypothetical protein [Stieleria sedimenti]MCS7466930.1 hypothetical protein [Stieleria sedimenti]
MKTDSRETNNLILKPDQHARVNRMRRELHQRLQESGGLAIPIGFKPNHGSSLRSPKGSKRSRFPEHMISP